MSTSNLICAANGKKGNGEHIMQTQFDLK